LWFQIQQSKDFFLWFQRGGLTGGLRDCDAHAVCGAIPKGRQSRLLPGCRSKHWFASRSGAGLCAGLVGKPPRSRRDPKERGANASIMGV